MTKKQLLILGAVVLSALTIAVTALALRPKTKIVEVEKEVIVEKEVPVEVVKVVEKEVVIEVEKQPKIALSSVERELLARLTYREGGTTTPECQAAIASVVVNRLQNGYWGTTISEVINSPHQFYVAPVLWCTTPEEDSYEAVDLVLYGGPILPDYVMYFNLGDPVWSNGYHDYCVIDGVHFGYYEQDIKEG